MFGACFDQELVPCRLWYSRNDAQNMMCGRTRKLDGVAKRRVQDGTSMRGLQWLWSIKTNTFRLLSCAGQQSGQAK